MVGVEKCGSPTDEDHPFNVQRREAQTNIRAEQRRATAHQRVLFDRLTETGRVRQSSVIHCQIRLVYSKSGVIAYVRFTYATN